MDCVLIRDCLSKYRPGGPRRALDVTWQPDYMRSRLRDHLAVVPTDTGVESRLLPALRTA